MSAQRTVIVMAVLLSVAWLMFRTQRHQYLQSTDSKEINREMLMQRLENENKALKEKLERSIAQPESTPATADVSANQKIQRLQNEVKALKEKLERCSTALPDLSLLNTEPIFSVSLKTKTDKVCDDRDDQVCGHVYHHLYAKYLPFILNHPNKRFLEIGLGCVSDRNEDVGRGARMWKEVLKGFDITCGEWNQTCMDWWGPLNKDVIKPEHLAQVDSTNADSLVNMMKKLKGDTEPFSMIVEDAGHTMKGQMTPLILLFPAIAPGGLYFVEDLHMGFYTGGLLDLPKDYRTPNFIDSLLRTWVTPDYWAPLSYHKDPPFQEYLLSFDCQKGMCAFIRNSKPARFYTSMSYPSPNLSRWPKCSNINKDCGEPDPTMDLEVQSKTGLSLLNSEPIFSVGLKTKTDKVCDDRDGQVCGHVYHHLYAKYLPFILNHPNKRFLEIGLGCVSDRNEDVGRGARMWKEVLKGFDITCGEWNQTCMDWWGPLNKDVIKSEHLVQVDQGNVESLVNMMKKLKGDTEPFSMIVEDGGHTMKQQMTSLILLFPAIAPGGVYFLEDLLTAFILVPNVFPGGFFDLPIPDYRTPNFIDALLRTWVTPDYFLPLEYHKDPPFQEYLLSFDCQKGMCAFIRNSKPARFYTSMSYPSPHLSRWPKCTVYDRMDKKCIEPEPTLVPTPTMAGKGI